jgi:integrase
MSAVSGARLAQWQSTSLTRKGSEVQILYRAPFSFGGEAVTKVGGPDRIEHLSKVAKSLPKLPKREGRYRRLGRGIYQGRSSGSVFEWRSLRHVYKRAFERLDLPSYELRTLRRCYIVHLRELNIHDAVVANFQGHADSALIQKTYGKNMSAEFIAREIAKAFVDRGSTP